MSPAAHRREGDHEVKPTEDLLATVHHLEQALTRRTTIGTAIGIIVATTRCTPEAAFDQLVRQSQHENIKLHDLADELVDHARTYALNGDTPAEPASD